MEAIFKILEEAKSVLFSMTAFFFSLYKFCTTPVVNTRVKPPSHEANIKAARVKT